MFDPLTFISQLPQLVFGAVFSFPPIQKFWWLWLFIILFFLARSFWTAYIQEHYIRVIPYVLLELKIPREIRKTPRAMEQVFMAIHAIRNSATDIKERWWDGEVPYTFSCEVVSFGGEVHFYMRMPSIRRNHMEAALYANYPDIEIVEAEDYVNNRLPATIDELEKAGYLLFGNELMLANKDVYPIETYVDFEAVAEEKELDPVSALLEVLARVRPQEHIWIQILVRPLVDEHITAWHKEGEKEIEEIKERSGKRRMYSPQFGEFIMVDRAPGDVEMMKTIDRNIAKSGFDTVIRYLYICPKEMFSMSFARRSVFMPLNQYASETYNKFRHNTAAWTLTKVWYFPFIFPGRRGRARRVSIYKKYKERAVYPFNFAAVLTRMNLFDWGWKAYRRRKMVLNTEELATIYHLPTYLVLTGPLIKRVEARKVGPPAGLPIYGEGGEDLPLEKK